MALWFLLIASYAGYKEYNLRTGQTVMLRVVPVDPRDMFRGDYVILNYDISRMPEDRRSEESSPYYGDTVYVSLVKDGDYYKAGQIFKSYPPKGLFIKGEVRENSFGISTIVYGIESYFVPEGEGHNLENAIRQHNVAAEVAINHYGHAVIKNLIIDGQKVTFKHKKEQESQQKENNEENY